MGPPFIYGQVQGLLVQKDPRALEVGAGGILLLEGLSSLGCLCLGVIRTDDDAEHVLLHVLHDTGLIALCYEELLQSLCIGLETEAAAYHAIGFQCTTYRHCRHLFLADGG